MIKARAIVDKLGNGLLGPYMVEVWGNEPYDYVRKYIIQSPSDDAAAREGLNRFEKDIKKLLDEK
jgi:hypothetical protein